MTDLKTHIANLVEENLPDESAFLVDIIIKGTNTGKKVLILIDGDQGVSIDTCADISRKVGNDLEENDLVDSAYTLEVSSPGLDHPLASIRQYRKNIGRRVRITLEDDKEAVGELLEVHDDKVLINKETKVKRKINKKETEIPFNDIRKTIVLVSF
ncbi:ribosome maturation factor RimP [Roseivirga sp. BDSF3-8]|uniref:ribosome maturation factor RimP n=1 Tax=Roseivirga sp. BDSF3-8 TaxID=3241598 RepID=UPI003531A1C3